MIQALPFEIYIVACIIRKGNAFESSLYL